MGRNSEKRWLTFVRFAFLCLAENIVASPLDVPTIKAQISTKEIVDCIHEGRER